jgi:hypothetical protein
MSFPPVANQRLFSDGASLENSARVNTRRFFVAEVAALGLAVNLVKVGAVGLAFSKASRIFSSILAGAPAQFSIVGSISRALNH